MKWKQYTTMHRIFRINNFLEGHEFDVWRQISDIIRRNKHLGEIMTRHANSVYYEMADIAKIENNLYNEPTEE